MYKRQLLSGVVQGRGLGVCPSLAVDGLQIEDHHDHTVVSAQVQGVVIDVYKRQLRVDAVGVGSIVGVVNVEMQQIQVAGKEGVDGPCLLYTSRCV